MSQFFTEELSILSDNQEMQKEVELIFHEMLMLIDSVSPDVKEEFVRLREIFLRSRQGQNVDLSNILNSVDIQHLNELIRFFSLYMMLLNIIEERHEVKRNVPDLEAAIERLISEGFEREKVLEVLEEIKFYPVFTAHPTESRRRTFLEAHHDIGNDLDQIFPFGNEEATEHLRYRLMLLWQSCLVREEKIEVLFELDNLLYIIESSALGAILKTNELISQTIGKPLKHSPVHLGSWIGGDRDGNPFVTNEVMTRVMKQQHQTIIAIYIKTINRLIRELSINANITPANEALLTSIKSESDHLSDDSVKLYRSEPVRAKLTLMKKKLENRLLYIHSSSDMEYVYQRSEELVEDIDLLIDSLDEVSARELVRFRHMVIGSGFHMMKLDFREHKDAIGHAITEIFSHIGVADADFYELPEEKRVEILKHAIKRPRVELRSLIGHVSKETEAITEAFIKIEWAKEKISEEIIDSFIISMTQKASDLLSVLWFAKQAGLWHVGEKTKISITPLFETIEDLQKAPAIIQQLVEDEHYSQYLKDRNNTQEIMIGYSDSSKDGGMFASNFNLNRAINNLMELEEKFGLKFLLFHGRGGSVSRGGGSMQAALMASPAKSVDGFLKTTEQGEVISSKYLNPKIAEHNFVRTISNLLIKSVYDRHGKVIDCGKKDQYTSLMKQISDASCDHYRQLVYHTEGFIQYFKEATPIFFIQQLNIGSRPSKRKDTHRVEDLRAIPWVFSWMQNRTILTAWYGVGSGLEKGAESAGKEALRNCYQECPFFRATIDNVAMTLLKTDLGIAEIYNQFVADLSLKGTIWEMITTEFYKTIEYILYIRNEQELLGNEKFLRQSILLRKPYLTALSIFQVELIREYRSESDQESQSRIIQQISSTIVGIAQGIRNTG